MSFETARAINLSILRARGFVFSTSSHKSTHKRRVEFSRLCELARTNATHPVLFYGLTAELFRTFANNCEDRTGGEGGIRTPDTLASMPHFECGAFNHSATSPEPESGLKRLRTDGRYVTKGAKTDKGYTSYIGQRSINPVTARQADV